MSLIILFAVLLLPSIASAQQPGFDPMDSILQGYELGERMDRTARGLPPMPPRAQAPLPYYEPPRLDMNDALRQQQLQQFLNQQFKDQVDRETGQGRYQGR